MGTIYWAHSDGTTNADGWGIINPGQPQGTHAIGIGGFVGVSTTPPSNDTEPDTVEGHDVNGMFAIAGSYPAYDAGTDTLYLYPIITGSPGARFRAHIWTLVEE